MDEDGTGVLDILRKRTWHKTISANNTVPSAAALTFHSKRYIYILNSVGNVTEALLKIVNSLNLGWIIVVIDNDPHIVPKWDSDESMEEINLVRKSFLRKCACKKGCQKRQCSCVKSIPTTYCNNLCTCVGCVNKPADAKSVDDDTAEDTLDDCNDTVNANEEEELEYEEEDDDEDIVSDAEGSDIESSDVEDFLDLKENNEADHNVDVIECNNLIA